MVRRRDPLTHFKGRRHGVIAVYKTSAPSTANTQYDLGTIWVDTTNKNIYVLASKGAGVATWDVITSAASDFQDSVKDYCAEGSATATEGYRYLSSATGTLWTENYIYEYRSGSWEGTAPSEGMIVWVEDENFIYCYTGSAWAKVSSYVGDASETVKGVVELATTAEVVAGTDTTRAVTTAGVTAKLGTQTDHGVLIGSGTTAAVTALTVGTNGQVLVGSTGADPVFATISSTDSSVTTSLGAGTLALTVTQATTSQLGGAVIASQAEVTAATNNTKMVTPLGLAVLSVGVDASESAKGIAELATQAETIAYTDANRIVVPLKLGYAFAAPPAIGSTTPAAATFTTLTTGSTVSLQAGQVDIATDNAANAVNIGLGNTARAIAIGSSSAAHLLTIGSTNGAAALSLLAGTGNVTINGAATTAINVGASLVAGTITVGGSAQTGNITLGSSSGTNAVYIGVGAGATTVNVATGITGNTVNIGTGANSSAQTINLATGASAANSTVNILSGNGSAGTQTCNILTGTRAGAVNIGTGSAAHTVTVGSTNTTAATVIQSGSGDVTITSTDAITLDAAGVLELNSSAGVIGIGNDAVAQNINIGTGAAARTITVGNITTTTALAFNAGTGGIALTSTSTGDITLASADTVLIDGAGVVEINSSAGVIGIGNDAVAQNINIGTGAAARVITVGNITTTSQIVLNSGTGGIQLASTGTGDITLNSSDTVLIDSAGVLELNSSAGIISIGNDAVAQNINIGTGAAARIITVGNVTTTTGLAFNAGTGGIAMTATGAGATTITATAGGVAIVGAANTIGIGNDAAANTVVVGSTNTTAATTIQSGTGDVTITSTDAVTIDAAGVLELNSSAGVIGIGNDAVAQNINVGTGAAARTITVGNSTTTTGIALTAGTGGITLGGKVIGSRDAITATDAGVAASLVTLITEITTNGDVDLDMVTLGDGVDGQVKIFAVVASGNVGDSVKITPTNLVGGTQITFAADPKGKGCMMIFDSGVGKWCVVGNNSGTIA